MAQRLGLNRSDAVTAVEGHQVRDILSDAGLDVDGGLIIEASERVRDVGNIVVVGCDELANFLEYRASRGHSLSSAPVCHTLRADLVACAFGFSAFQGWIVLSRVQSGLPA